MAPQIQTVIDADNETQLRVQLCELLRQAKSSGSTIRKKDELLAICRLLEYLRDSREISLPIKVLSRECPDFVIQMDYCIGIEVVHAIPSRQAHEDAIREKKGAHCPSFVGKYSPGDKPEGKKAIVARLEREREYFKEDFVGDESEENWAVAMYDCIERKVHTARSYDTFSKNWLAVLDSWVVPGLDQSLASKKLFKKLQDRFAGEGFGKQLDAVYILRYPTVLCIPSEEVAR